MRQQNITNIEKIHLLIRWNAKRMGFEISDSFCLAINVRHQNIPLKRMAECGQDWKILLNFLCSNMSINIEEFLLLFAKQATARIPYTYSTVRVLYNHKKSGTGLFSTCSWFQNVSTLFLIFCWFILQLKFFTVSYSILQ